MLWPWSGIYPWSEVARLREEKITLEHTLTDAWAEINRLRKIVNTLIDPGTAFQP